MEASTLLPLSRYSTTALSLLTEHRHNSSFDTDEHLCAQMGKKKNTKKLNQQLTAAPPGNQPHQPLPATQAPLAGEAAPVGLQQGQDKKSKGQKKRAAKKRKQQRQQERALRGQNGAGQSALNSGPEDPTAHFTSQHGCQGGMSDDQASQGAFVGQPLLEALEIVQMDGGEFEVMKAGPGPGRRTSLAWRPATADGAYDGPPPDAPTQPRAARNGPPLGAPTQPKAWAQPQPQPLPPRGHAVPPQTWQDGARTGPAQATAPFSQASDYSAPTVPAVADYNPYGYNLQNATWDWNKFGGGNSVSEISVNADGTGNLVGSRPGASWSDQEAGTGSAYLPGAYDSTSGHAQQPHLAAQQPYGQAPGWNDYPQQSSMFYQSGNYPAYQGLDGLRYIHGHTNSFTPSFPTPSVLHYYQGHNWRVNKHYSVSNRGLATKAGKKSGLVSPERTSESEGGENKGSKPARRSKRLAAKDAAEDQVSRSWNNHQGSQKFRSPSPTKFPLGSPLENLKFPLKPKPKEEYRRLASIPPKQLDAPQTLLVVIDLNGTLVHRPSRKNSARVICRPYVQAFLDYLLANHRVMVWSSARPENVGKMCTQLFEPRRRAQLVAEWGRDTLGLTAEQYNWKVQVYKKLSQVWHAAGRAAWHPRHAAGERFGQHNTLLIDDSLLKASSEPHNLVQVEEFEGRPDQMRSDVLRQVVGYLEQARWVSDVSAWVNTEGQRFEFGKGWDYEWPEGTRADAVPESGPDAGRDMSGAGHEWWRATLGRRSD